MKQIFIPSIASILVATPIIYLANQTQTEIKQEPTEKEKNREIYKYIQYQLNKKEQIEFAKSTMWNIDENIKQKNQILFEKDTLTMKSLEQKIHKDFCQSNLDENFMLNIRYIKKTNSNDFINQYQLFELKNAIKIWEIDAKIYNFSTNDYINDNFQTISINHELSMKYLDYVINQFFTFDNINISIIKNYLLFLKKWNPKEFANAFEEVISHFTKYKNLKANSNPIKHYIENEMWNDYQNEIMNNEQPVFTGDSINGYDMVNGSYSKYFFMGMLGVAIKKLMFRYLAQQALGMSLIKFLGIPLTPALIAIGIAYFIGQSLWAANGLLKEAIEENLTKYINDKKDSIVELYGFATGEQFEQFLWDGFQIGFISKLKSLFGKEAIKDRAYMIYDSELNRNWMINWLDISSYAKLVGFFGFPTYERRNETTVFHLSSYKKIFYTAMNGVRVPFVRTYYGYVSNPYQNNYVLEQGNNWLKETKLEMKPHFSKLGYSTIKNRFVEEHYLIFNNGIYSEGIEKIQDNKLKKHLVKLNNIKQNLQKTNQSLKQNSKVSLFMKEIYEVYN